MLLASDETVEDYGSRWITPGTFLQQPVRLTIWQSAAAPFQIPSPPQATLEVQTVRAPRPTAVVGGILGESMAAQVFVYLFQFLIYTLLVWMGCHYAGRDLPTPMEAPWLWLLVAVAPLIRSRWGDYGETGPGLGFDGDYGDGGD
ncbi:hypothetical protein [Aeoliella straminimaris]|uniref:hypothetical protein n=1 Tax=Aeoliella straminimaris TaxID=2954799 RepID=UPI002092C220|nr:hypothetical protein [Aeoliella straminimaris]